MALEKPNSNASKRKKPSTRAVQPPIVQPSNTSPPQTGATAVTLDADTPTLDYPESDETATPSDGTRQEPSTDISSRKRSLTDEAEMSTISSPDKFVKANTSKHGIISASTKRRKVSKPAFDNHGDDALDVHKGAKGSLKGVEAEFPPSSTNDQNQKVKTRRSKRTEMTPLSTRKPWVRVVGKRLKMRRRDLLGMQLKPAVRLLAEPRFIRKAKDDHSWREDFTAAVVQETKSFLDILEPGLPGLMDAEAFSKTFHFPANIDAKIAKGLKAAAVESDPKEGSNEMEESDGDGISSIEANKKAKWLNTLVVHKGLDRSQPPINTLPDIFEDMVKRGWEGFQGKKLLKASIDHILGRELRVGTMCSGTECPVIALGLINDALTRLGHPTIPFIHVLSCEIIPCKQAYIQRNFDPQHLFRDVTELPEDRASTAYGSAVPVPGDLDILIAGSSCKDYSGLNNHQKEYGEEGQSLSTFQGILGYVKRYKPRIVLLENVSTAPWKHLQQELQGVGYVAFVAKVDTKNFYIPQTRNRGYMIGFNREFAAVAPLNLENIGTTWADIFEAYSRRASSPFTDFIYSEGDPLLDQARLEMIVSQSLEKSRRKVDWHLCRHRYVSFRAAHGLGFRRPVTMWENNGTCKFPDGSWLKWAKGQVERIWDTIDINQLRCVAQRDYDSRFKSRAVELSQNVDRDNDSSPWGIISCITPTGTSYLTTRGGPITGPELLALQGIPTEKLSLTYETAKQLQDFAGNAMTSTVVAAAMLAAFGVGYKILERGSDVTKMRLQRRDIPFHELTNDATGKPRTEKPLPVGPIHSDSFARIQSHSSSTMQLCSCEGRFGCHPGSLQRCLSCGHTTCTTCGQNPLHKYELIPKCVSDQRGDPSEFEEKIKNWLPLQLQFEEIDIPTSSFSGNAVVLDAKNRVMQAIKDAFGHRLHLMSLGRTRSWTATYESSHARLDIIFNRKWAPRSSLSRDLTGFLGAIGVQCYLYAKAGAEESVDSLVRADLAQPIARMTCKQSIHDGGWEIRLPEPEEFTLDIKYFGQHVDSWEANLNLQEKNFRDRQVTQKVMLSCSAGSDTICPRQIPGVYELLPYCDSASGSLYRKLDDGDFNSGANHDPVFFFLDPRLLCNAAQDSLVFAITHHRTLLDGARDVLARIEKGTRLASSPSDILPCTIPGQWQEYRQTYLEVPKQDDVNIKISVPKSTASIHIDITRCTHVDFTALVCSFPLREDQHKQWIRENIYSIDLIDKVDALRPFTHLVQRAGLECGFDDWVEIAIPLSPMTVCQICAPAKPRLVFPTAHFQSIIKHAKAQRPLLVEDQHQAFEFEKKMKTRPSPVVANLHCQSDGDGILQLQLNIATLVHRAYGKLVGQVSKWALRPRIQWRLAKDSGFEQFLPFPKLSLKGNAEDLELDIPPNWVENGEVQLYPAQLRSLRWMSKQESDEAPPWVEEEVEEAQIPSANLRLEAKVKCTRPIRGGILADEVGYGKTATILALFDSDASDLSGKRRLPTTTSTTTDGKIKVKATLVLAPADLVKQWQTEVNRFLCKESSDEYVVLPIDSEEALRDLTVKDICEADLILSTWKVFGDWYLEELSYLSRSPQLPKHPGRAFQQWLSQALNNLSTFVLGSKACEYQDHRPTWRKLDQQKPQTQGLDITHQTPDEGCVEEAKKLLDDNFKMVDMKERNDPKIAPLLHLFCFRRVVTDEFTYVQGKDLSLLLQMDASRKWALSGTPPLGSFREVNNMAMLLGTKLSNDDNDGGMFESRSVLKEKMKDKTLAEEFHFYSHQTRHSPSWYKARYQSCISFAQQFIRQNPAELRGVDLLHHYEVFDLAAAERVTYFELFQMLMSQSLPFSGKEPRKKTETSAESAEWDRTKRLQEMASASRSPEEALLICCSTSMSTVNGIEAHERSAGKVCEAILTEEKKHFTAEVEQLYEKVREVFEIWKLGYCDDPEDNPHFFSFIRCVDNNVFGDLVTKAMLDHVLGHAQTEASKSAMNSELIPHGRHNRRLSKDKKAMKTKSDTRPKSEQEVEMKTMQDDTGEEPTKEVSSAQAAFTTALATRKAETKKGTPDLRELAPRSAFMYKAAADLTNLSLRLVDNIRGLRFSNIISDFVNVGHWPNCSKCGKKPKNANDVLIMGICGHPSCLSCFEAKRAQQSLVAECVAEGCEAPAPRLSALPLSDLDTATSYLPHPYGSKIDAVLELLQDRNRVQAKDHVVIFIQFQRLKAALIEALEDANITYLDSSNKNAVEDFKTGTATICILDPESVNAAGWNLQIANHIIFLSSLVISTQYRYKSIYEQAIGRVYRRGQKKDVHIYHFLAAQTIDVNILEDREGKTLVQRDGKYLFLTESEIMKGDKGGLAGAPFDGAACSVDD